MTPPLKSNKLSVRFLLKNKDSGGQKLPTGVYERTTENQAPRIHAICKSNTTPEFRAKMSQIVKSQNRHSNNTTPETILKIIAKNKERLGEKHPAWKADDASYYAKHLWINRHYGRASQCELNPEHKANRYHWANLSGRYRDRGDYVQLCPSCHSLFDLGKITIKGIKKKGWFVQDYKNVKMGG